MYTNAANEPPVLNRSSFFTLLWYNLALVVLFSNYVYISIVVVNDQLRCQSWLVAHITTHLFFLGGGDGGGLFAISCSCLCSWAIWPLRSFSDRCIFSMASLIDLFWLEASCLSLCSSSIFALIMFCICSLWASMADLICSSRRRFSSSCFAFKSSNWNKQTK